MAKLWTAIGSISGTSMDGIDVSIVTTDGEAQVRAGVGQTVPYPAALRAELLAFLENPVRAETEPLTDLERAVTDAHVQAIETFIAGHGIDRSTVDLAGMHGQTVWHRPEKRFTRTNVRKFTRETPLMPSGLLGPVTLQRSQPAPPLAP